MNDPRPANSSARGDAEIIIAPDGTVTVFDLDAGLLPAVEALAPGDPRVQAARRALDIPRLRPPTTTP